MKHIAENPFDPQKKKGEPDNGTRIKRPIEATCKPLAESSFESGSLSEMLLLQCFDGISIPVISTNSECLGITPGHLSCIDYAIIK